MKRREFLPGILATALGTQIPSVTFANKIQYLNSMAMPKADSPSFWEEIRAQFRGGEFVNLNNGAVSPSPLCVEEAFFNRYRIANETPSLHLRRTLEADRDIARNKLANLLGCPSDEIAINRNATEALVTIIMGLKLKRGDEVVLSIFDYPSMVNAWKIRAQRDGIKLVWVNTEIPGGNNAAVADAYITKFTPKTRVVHITHMTNWTGRLVPAKQIIAAARERNIITLVDAAHTVAHIPFRVDDLNCDYLGASLHKWLCGPFGTGVLFSKKENIAGIPSLFPTEPDVFGNVKKFEELGTRNLASEASIGEAVDFHEHIGGQRKLERLVELRNYWVDQVKDNPKFKINSPLQLGMGGAIAVVSIIGKNPPDITLRLYEDYKIHCVNTIHEGISGIRISPHIYTSKSELDYFVQALLKLAD